MGEGLDALEEFRPEGSPVESWVSATSLPPEDFDKVIDEEKAEADAKKLLSGKFDMWDFLSRFE